MTASATVRCHLFQVCFLQVLVHCLSTGCLTPRLRFRLVSATFIIVSMQRG